MPELHFPWLELSIFVPLLGGSICFLLREARLIHLTASIVSGFTLLFALGEWIDFSTLGTFAAHDHWDLTKSLYSREVFVIDELSAPLLPLAALIHFLLILSTPQSKAIRFPFMMALLSEAICMATLCCINTGLLVALLGLSMLPLWFEMRDRRRITRVFSLHMGIYVLLLLISVVLIKYYFALPNIPFVASILLLMASLLRAGVIPVHVWMADLFEKASFGSALLFVLPMTGAYAVMRLVLPVAPMWAMQSIAFLSLATAVYSAGMALVQTEMRRFFCYLFLSQSSLVLVGLEISNEVGLTGALCVWLSIGLSLGGLGLVMRVVEARVGKVQLDRYHGLFEQMPLFASLFLLTGLSSIGFPGTVGFVGMELLVEGTVEFYPLVGVGVVLGAALNGIAIIRAYFRIFTGTRHVASISLEPRRAEKFAVICLSLLIVGGGVWPQPFVQSRFHAARALLEMRHSALGLDNQKYEAGSPQKP